MNDARMTLRLPGEYLEFAKNYAGERGMSLTDLVIGYFRTGDCGGEAQDNIRSG